MSTTTMKTNNRMNEYTASPTSVIKGCNNIRKDHNQQAMMGGGRKKIHRNSSLLNTATMSGGTVEQDGLRYHSGFGNAFSSECLPGALPVGRNTPRNVPYNLYTEQLSGTAFTAPRATNRRTWIYRMQPSVATGRAEPVLNASTGKQAYFGHANPADCLPEINPLRWQPMTMDTMTRAMTTTMTGPAENTTTTTSAAHQKIDFLRGMHLQCTSANDGGASHKFGLSIYQYCFNADMVNSSLMNADGEVCIVPQHGSLYIRTELGCLVVHPKELAVIPAGIVHSLDVYRGETTEGAHSEEREREEEPPYCRGYVLEICSKGGGFALPTLGPIGANGLANARDFLVPVAAVAASTPQEYERPHTIYTKSGGGLLWKRTQQYTPYNVVAWHGNYTPHKYTLDRFCAVNSVSYDHLDPSIFTVLTCQSETEGTALADVVIFPPRWQATDPDTFRPPYYHRHCMSEYMGLITGKYDAKMAAAPPAGKKNKRRHGFVPGGSSLHPIMTPHGPDEASYNQAMADPQSGPDQLEGGLAFMFETALPLAVAPAALRDDIDWREMDYADCWQGLTAEKFTGWDLLQQLQEEAQQQQEIGSS